MTAVIAPLENGPIIDNPRRVNYELLGKETVDGKDLLHLRVVPDPADKVDTNDLPEEWLASDGKSGWLLRRSPTSRCRRTPPSRRRR